jgi:ubiquinone/menaquinone biosynthesis C-methylase UbiE
MLVTKILLRKRNMENWVDFWSAKNISSEKISKVNMDIFIKASERILGYEEEDVVLDIGSGFGYLASFLKHRVREIHCLDISEWFVDVSTKRLSQEKNVFSHKLDPKNYTDLSIVRDKRFSKIICLSVIQYYKNVGEVESLIEEVRRVAAPGAKCLIADIPTDTKVYTGAWPIMKAGFSKFMFLEVMKALIKHRISKYHELRSNIGLLVLSKERLNGLIKKLDVDAEVISSPMTVNMGRSHILINF